MTSARRETRVREPRPEEEVPGGALVELLELERRIEGELEAARVEASRAVEAARAEAQALASDPDAGFEPALQELSRSVDAEADATIAALERTALAEIEVFERVDEAALRRLARRLVEQLVAGAAP